MFERDSAIIVMTYLCAYVHRYISQMFPRRHQALDWPVKCYTQEKKIAIT